MKKDNHYHRKAVCERILRVWEKMPELTLEILSQTAFLIMIIFFHIE